MLSYIYEDEVALEVEGCSTCGDVHHVVVTFRDECLPGRPQVACSMCGGPQCDRPSIVRASGDHEFLRSPGCGAAIDERGNVQPASFVAVRPG